MIDVRKDVIKPRSGFSAFLGTQSLSIRYPHTKTRTAHVYRPPSRGRGAAPVRVPRAPDNIQQPDVLVKYLQATGQSLVSAHYCSSLLL